MRIGLDLDGTIITCEQKHSALMQTICTAYEITLCLKKYWLDKRVGLSNVQALLAQNIPLDTVKAMSIDWISCIEDIQWLSFDSLIPDVIDSLIKLKNQQHTLHLISARKNKSNALFQLNHLNIAHLFESIDFINLSYEKEKSNYMSERQIDCYIGDTEYDFIMAKRATIPFYLVTSGMRSRDFLLKYNHVTYDSLKDINFNGYNS